VDYKLFDGEKITEVNENIKLIQRENGLTFGTDAFLLASFIKEQRNGIAVELGGGTGIISLLCASRNKFNTIHCIEIQEDFANIIERNAKLNALDEKVISIHKDIRKIKSANIGVEVEAVFSNPPYMKVDSGKRNEHDEKFIARHEVCGDIGDFCAAAKRLLKHGGYFYCVWRPDRLTDLICSMRENALEPKEMCFVHANTKSAPSVVLVKAKKGAATGVSVIEPLFLNLDNDAKTLTERAKKIYEECNF
jgi:tRNA1Val (adenine37-N6)-methyltransferase